MNNGDSCGCDSTVILKKTASTATTVTYSIIYVANNNPSGCMFCGPDGLIYDDPTNTSVDWLWDCAMGMWTIGGWNKVNDGTPPCPQDLTHFTGVSSISNGVCGFPFQATITITVA